MPIKNGDFIKITFTARTGDGKVFDTTEEETAKQNNVHDEKMKYGKRTIIVGSHHIVRGLDDDLVGKEVGHDGKVEIPPAKGFGELSPALVETHTVTRFPERPYPGMQIVMDGRVGFIETVIGRRARVNFNHPLAGKKLVYEYTIKEKIEDAKEKAGELLKIFAGVQAAEVVFDEEKKAVSFTLQEAGIENPLKKMIADEIFAHIGVEEVKFAERFVKAKKEEAKVEAKVEGKEEKVESA